MGSFDLCSIGRCVSVVWEVMVVGLRFFSCLVWVGVVIVVCSILGRWENRFVFCMDGLCVLWVL